MTHNTQKYQYLRPNEWYANKYPNIKGCCITIATVINKEEGLYSCNWIVTFKNPKDQFSKKTARETIANMDTNNPSTFSGTIILGKHYKRVAIVAKILSVLFYHENQLTMNYKEFVRHWLSHFMFE